MYNKASTGILLYGLFIISFIFIVGPLKTYYVDAYCQREVYFDKNMTDKTNVKVLYMTTVFP